MNKKLFAAAVLSVVLGAALAAPALAGKIGPNGQEMIVPVNFDGGVAVFREMGYPSAAQRCYEVSCAAGGDGGVLGVPPDGGVGSLIVAGRRYVSTVLDDSPVRVRNGGACGAFAGGTGRLLNASTTLDWVAKPAPDGGVPLYTCCARATGVTWQLCEQEQ